MRLMRALLAAALLLAAPAAAQDREQTLADIRQELTVLFVEMQRLHRELSTTGAPEGQLASTNALERLDEMETEVRRLTAASEQLANRVQSIVADGTNRIGDLEFRLCELEADCDIASLGETTTLGGSLVRRARAGRGRDRHPSRQRFLDRHDRHRRRGIGACRKGRL